MKKYNVNVIAIIPAKTDSVRLKNKNLQIIDSRSLVEHSIIYAERSKYIKEIYVNTESQEIKNYSKTYPIKIIERNKKLMGKTEVVEVYIESMKEIYNQTELDNIDIVIGLQPDHPDRMINIDNAIDSVKAGANDFIEKPFETKKLLHIIQKNLLELQQRVTINNYRNKISFHSKIDTVGSGQYIDSIFKTLSKIQNNSSILIIGPNGIGKNFLANTIHMNLSSNNIYEYYHYSFSCIINKISLKELKKIQNCFFGKHFDLYQL